MSAAVLPVPAPAAPRPRLWTRAEFYRLGELGFFRGQRAERIGGQIVVMSPQNWPHAVATDKATETIRAAFGAGFWVRSQLPLELGQSSDPEPDVSVVAGKRGDYTDHPRTAVLVVEASDSSLAYDRGEKANLYAAAGIADYWVLDVANGRLEVFRDPQPDPAAPFGAGYTRVAAYGPGESVAPLSLPAVPVAVADLLP